MGMPIIAIKLASPKKKIVSGASTPRSFNIKSESDKNVAWKTSTNKSIKRYPITSIAGKPIKFVVFILLQRSFILNSCIGCERYNWCSVTEVLISTAEMDGNTIKRQIDTKHPKIMFIFIFSLHHSLFL